MREPGRSAASQVPSRFAVIAKLGCPAGGGRGADREAAICQAVVELLNETSYESVTMDAVAARAKASKATIYRRWSNKDNLVVDALQRQFEANRNGELPDTGSLRTDLMARIDQQLSDAAVVATNMAALKALIYAASSDPALAQTIRRSVQKVELQPWQAVLDRAHRRGELARPVRADLVFEVAQGQFCSRTTIDPGELDLEFVEHLIDDVLMPVIMHAGTVTPARAASPASAAGIR